MAGSFVIVEWIEVPELEFKDVYLFPGGEATFPQEPWYPTHLVKYSGGRKYRVYARQIEETV